MAKSIFAFIVGIFLLVLPHMAIAQDAANSDKSSKSAHWAARGAAEVGMGALMGAAVGGSAFLTGLLVNPRAFKTTLIISGIRYPTAVASGAILGGYLTDSRST